MKRFFTIAAFTSIVQMLAACSGMTGAGGNGGSGGTTPAAVGGALDQTGGGEGPGAEPPPQVVAHATGEGLLGSQSTHSDLVPTFYREFSLFFQGETPDQASGPSFFYLLPSNPGTLPSAQLRRLQVQIGDDSQGSPCPNCAGMWVRAVNCGPYDDEAIGKLITGEEKTNPVASNPLLWFLLHMPRPSDNPAVTTCEGARSMDFAVGADGAVDMSKLELAPDEIVVFYPMDANPGADILPLSTQGYSQIPKEKIAASNKHGLARYVRPAAPLKIPPTFFQVYQEN